MLLRRAPRPAGPAFREECRTCAQFRNDPAYLEQALPGIRSFSSAHASVRADDGVCLRHDRYLGARSWCPDFEAAKAVK